MASKKGLAVELRSQAVRHTSQDPSQSSGLLARQQPQLCPQLPKCISYVQPAGWSTRNGNTRCMTSEMPGGGWLIAVLEGWLIAAIAMLEPKLAISDFAQRKKKGTHRDQLEASEYGYGDQALLQKDPPWLGHPYKSEGAPSLGQKSSGGGSRTAQHGPRISIPVASHLHRALQPLPRQ